MAAGAIARHELPLFPREKHSAALVPNPSLLAELGRAPPAFQVAILTCVKCSFVRLGFASLLAWEFRQHSEWTVEQPPHQIRPPWWIAEDACFLAPRQRALRPCAFAPVWALRKKISSDATSVWFVQVLSIRKESAQEGALLAWKPLVSFREQQSPPVRESPRPTQRCRVLLR